MNEFNFFHGVFVVFDSFILFLGSHVLFFIFEIFRVGLLFQLPYVKIPKLQLIFLGVIGLYIVDGPVKTGVLEDHLLASGVRLHEA